MTHRRATGLGGVLLAGGLALLGGLGAAEPSGGASLEPFWTAARAHDMRVGVMVASGGSLDELDAGAVNEAFRRAVIDLRDAPGDIVVFTMLAFSHAMVMASEPDLRDSIEARGKAVIPTLLSLLNETGRTWLGYLHNDGYHAFTIGRVSFQLMEDIVEPHAQNARSRLDRDGAWIDNVGFLEHFDDDHQDIDAEALAAWWRDHGHLSLRELRIQALRWRIQSERRKGFRNAEEEREWMAGYEDQLAELLGAR